MPTFAEQVIEFNDSLLVEVPLPEGVDVLNPFLEKPVQEVTHRFYSKYYNDSRKRFFLFGINPGRFGAGITGIPFTDPVNLKQVCGIDHFFEPRHELSSQFIYEVIAKYGGATAFYTDFYITSVCPLGFTRDVKNLNYYDNKALQLAVDDFILSSIRRQLSFGTTKKACICVGEGKNFNYLHQLNVKHGFFDRIYPLPHPRFVLQYKRKQKEVYIERYLETLHACRSGL